MDGSLDEALERLDGTGFEFGPAGLSNHGPMAAEALVRLGRGEEAPRWVDRYRCRLGPAPDPTDPVDDGTWRAGLGDIRRVADWQAYLRRQMDDGPWADVVARWVPRLLPGIMAAATHGVIRTAHAVRALDESETALRLDELAAGLAYWAARYQEVPGTPRLRGTKSVAQAAAAIPAASGFTGGLISDAVRAVGDFDGFGDAVDGMAAPVSVDDALSDLTATCARVYLADAGAAPIAFIHAVTGPAALRLLLPHLPPAIHATAFAYAWQTGAALLSAYGGTAPVTMGEAQGPEGEPMLTDPPGADKEGSVRGGGPEDLIERAVANGDEHAIKFTEACLRENDIRPDPAYLAAALDSTSRL